jgi:hypothetical protein
VASTRCKPSFLHSGFRGDGFLHWFQGERSLAVGRFAVVWQTFLADISREETTVHFNRIEWIRSVAVHSFQERNPLTGTSHIAAEDSIH